MWHGFFYHVFNRFRHVKAVEAYTKEEISLLAL